MDINIDILNLLWNSYSTWQRFHSIQIYLNLALTSGNCTITNPCTIGQHGCTSDKECENNLRCGDKNCQIIEPFESKEKSSTNNCCHKPEG